MLEIFVNHQRVNLYENEPIKYTFQVNDIAEIKDRQAHFTNTFYLPKTPNNIYLFGGLGIHSDTSKTPYQKLLCTVKYGGFTLIEKGWLNITETEQDYKCYIYSGVINFFKTIENKTLNDVPLTEIEHTKSLTTVLNSYTGHTPYRYLLADYNGQSHYKDTRNQSLNTDIINIDPLVPSVQVAYLWNKIHQRYGFSYEGTIFQSQVFTNLWLSYPKSAGLNDKTQIDTHRTTRPLIAPNTLDFLPLSAGKDNEHYELTNHPNQQNGGGFANAPKLITGDFIKFKQKGVFSIDLELKTTTYASPITLYLCKANDTAPLKDYELYIVDGLEIPYEKKEKYSFDNIQQKWHHEEWIEINAKHTFKLHAEEGIHYFFIIKQNQSKGQKRSGTSGNFAGDNSKQDDEVPMQTEILNGKLHIYHHPHAIVDFQDQLKQYSVDEFVKEIINRFGLTMFIDENKNHIVYKTLKERLQGEVIDWSHKYIERNEEHYVYNTYARQNWFRFQYEDKNATEQDGVMTIDNENLPLTKEVWKSKTYAPQSLTHNFPIGNQKYTVPFVKLFDRTEKINSNNQTETTYKPLEKRFYFLKAKTLTTPSYYGSLSEDPQSVRDSIRTFVADFDGLSWKALISVYYDAFQQIISRAKIHHILLDFDTIDAIRLDFQKVYYFAQEQQYYLLNRLTFEQGKPAKGEFVRIENYQTNTTKDTEVPQPPITPPSPPPTTETVTISIGWWHGTYAGTHDIENENDSVGVTIREKSDNATILQWQIKPHTTQEWQNIGNGEAVLQITNLSIGRNQIRLMAQTQKGTVAYSNILQYTRTQPQEEKCRAYSVRRAVSGFRDTASLQYNDCNGQPQRIELPYGNTQTLVICAKKIIRNNGMQITPTEGNCNDTPPSTPPPKDPPTPQPPSNPPSQPPQKQCKRYLVSAYTDLFYFTYIDCNGQPQTIERYAHDFEQFSHSVCAQENTIEGDQIDITEQGNCS